jgi:hypothetical protein
VFHEEITEWKRWLRKKFSIVVRGAGRNTPAKQKLFGANEDPPRRKFSKSGVGLKI